MEHENDSPKKDEAASEETGLATVFQLLATSSGGLPVDTNASKRLRILQVGVRPVNTDQLKIITQALLQRKQLRVLYHGRNRDETTERTISPQRLVCYRGNWYLDTWCHLREGLRHFALERLHVIAVLDATANDIPDADLDSYFASAYGIFSGEAAATAVLKFSPSVARWVADEQWHPQQQSSVLRDGSFELRFPYGDERELVMDILRYGPEVEVLAPDNLRHRIAQLAARTASLYRKPVKRPKK